MPHNDDQALVKQLLKGHKESFNAFFDSYQPRLFRFCITRLPTEDVCNDLVQQTLIDAMRGLHTYRGEASLFTWLCQIARNVISQWYKKHGKVAQTTSSIDQDGQLRASIESLPSDITGKASAEDETQNELVRLTLDCLPDNYGDLLELKYIEGLSVAEIGAKLSVGEIAIQSMLARARKAFRQTFTDLESQLSVKSH